MSTPAKLASIFILLVFSGCCTDVRSGEGAPIPKWSHPAGVEVPVSKLRDKPYLTLAELRKVAEHVAEHPIDPTRGAQGLAVSGGGAFAAWSAGWVTGAMEAKGSDALPRKLDMVTGVSAGALVTPLIFANQHCDLERLETAMKTTSDDDIGSRRGLLRAVLGSCDALGSTDKLPETIEETLTNEWILALGKDEVNEGRWFFIGTVNNDTGEYVIWNMVGLARAAVADHRYLRTFRDVIRASAAVPVLFDPVKLGDSVHIDGGTRRNIFFSSTVGALCAAYEAAIAKGESCAQPTVWAVVSGTLSLKQDCSTDLIGYGGRAISLLLRQGLLFALEEIKRTADTAKARFQLGHAIDADVPPGFEVFRFEPTLMAKLYDAAFLRGRKGEWSTTIPESMMEDLR